ncbi:MAG: hypothetical protein KAT38_03190 [Bacteroidales bacterium]|nr:hypothetical protein [Bacteroidales bacterium]
MINLISFILGVVGIVIVIVGIFPFLGWINWIAVAISLIGVILGFIAAKDSGRNLNLVVLIVALFRLAIGGGII